MRPGNLLPIMCLFVIGACTSPAPAPQPSGTSLDMQGLQVCQLLSEPDLDSFYGRIKSTRSLTSQTCVYDLVAVDAFGVPLGVNLTVVPGSQAECRGASWPGADVVGDFACAQAGHVYVVGKGWTIFLEVPTLAIMSPGDITPDTHNAVNLAGVVYGRLAVRQ